jgi:AcrR family transcriptional regulator
VRPSRSTEARSRIIRAAADLFHKQGVNATGPDQVIEASGTGKGQFYHYFRNKQGLVHEVLQTHLAAIKVGFGTCSVQHPLVARLGSLVSCAPRIAKEVSDDARLPIRHHR